MFILTYSSPTTGEVTELFATREAAEAEAADVRRAMDAVGYGAYSGDCVRVRDTADMPDEDLWDLPDDVQARIVAAEWEAHDRRIDARIRTLDFPFSTEAEARYWRRVFVSRGFEASGILDDWDRDVYTFTVYTVED